VKLGANHSLRLIAGLAFLAAMGCYKENPMAETELADLDSPTVVAVTPENGAVGVTRYANYGIKFDSPMDTASVRINLYLAGGDAMQCWLDSMSIMHDGHGMGGGDRDGMMHWLDSIGYSGHIEWNGHADSCVFYPDSLLRANCDHLLFLDSGICDAEGQLMIMDGSECGGLVFYFRTGAQ